MPHKELSECSLGNSVTHNYIILYRYIHGKEFLCGLSYIIIILYRIAGNIGGECLADWRISYHTAKNKSANSA